MKKKILVIDDEPGIREVLNIHLSSAGYAVASAGTAAEGLDLISTGHFDLAICDFSLPDKSGGELVSAIMEIRPSLGLMVLSGFLDDSVIDDFRARGVAGCLTKPVSKDTLLSTVGEYFGGGPADLTSNA